MQTFNIADAKAHFSELIQKALMGQEVIIARGNKPLVRLVPIVAPQQRSPGSAKGLIEISADFDAPLEDFKDYQ